MEKLSLLFLSVMILFISCGSDNDNEGNTVDETTTSIISVWESNESVNGNISVVSFDDKGHYIKLIAKSELFLMSSGNYKIENQTIRFIDEFDNSKNETLDYSIKDNSLMLDGKSYSRVGDPGKRLHDDVLHISKKPLRGELSGFLSICQAEASCISPKEY